MAETWIIRSSPISEEEYVTLLGALLQRTPVTRRQPPFQVVIIVAATAAFLWWRMGERFPWFVWPIMVLPGLLIGLWKSNWLRPDHVFARLRREYQLNYAPLPPLEAHFAPDRVRLISSSEDINLGYPQFERVLRTNDWLVLIHTLGTRYYLAVSGIVPPATVDLLLQRLAQNGVDVTAIDV